MSTQIPKNVTTDYDSISTIYLFPLAAGPGPGDKFTLTRKLQNWKATPEYIAAHTVGGGPYPPLVGFDIPIQPPTTNDNWSWGKLWLSPDDAATLNMPPANFVYPAGTSQPASQPIPVDLTKIKSNYVLTSQAYGGGAVLYNMAAAPPTPVAPGSSFPQEALDILRRMNRWLDAQNVPQ